MTVGGLIVAVFLVAAIAPGLLTSHKPDALYVGPPPAAHGSGHWLGTDELGRDFFARVGLRCAVVVADVSDHRRHRGGPSHRRRVRLGKDHDRAAGHALAAQGGADGRISVKGRVISDLSEREMQTVRGVELVYMKQDP